MWRPSWACGLWLIFGLACACSRVPEPPYLVAGAVVEDEFPALVLIETRRAEEHPKVWAGYFLPPDLVVTARHCLLAAEPEGYVNFGAGGTRRINGVRDFGDDIDLAVLRIEPKDEPVGGPATANRGPAPGEGTTIVTRHADGRVRQRTGGFAVSVTSFDGWRLAVITNEAAPGFSGGLVLDDSGRVLAVPIEGAGLSLTKAVVLDEAALETIRESDGFVSLSEWIEAFGRPEYASSLHALRRAAGEESSGNFDQAIRLLEEAVSIDPQYCDAWRNWIRLLSETGRGEEARQRLQEWSSTGHCEFWFELVQGTLLSRESNLAAAESHFRRAIALEPRMEAYTNLIYALMLAGRESEAERILAEARSLHPDDPTLLRIEMRKLITDGEAARALPLADELARLDYSADAFHVRALALAHVDQHEASLDVLNDGISRYPHDGELLALRSYALQKLDRLEEATSAARQGTIVDPGSSNAWLRLGICLRQAGSWQQAASAFERAAAVNKTPNTVALLVDAHRRAGNEESARRWLQELEILSPHYAQRLKADWFGEARTN